MPYNDRELEAAVSLLIDEMEGDQGDRHELWQRVHTMIEQLRATGTPAPDDLKRMAAALEAEFSEPTKS